MYAVSIDYLYSLRNLSQKQCDKGWYIIIYRFYTMVYYNIDSFINLVTKIYKWNAIKNFDN